MISNSKYWIAQTVGWTGYLVFLFVTTFILGKIEWNHQTVFQLLINVIVGFTATHLLHKIYTRIQFGRQFSTWQILVILSLSAFMAFVMTFFTELFEVLLFGELIVSSWKAFVFQLLGNLLLFLIWNLFYFLYHFISLNYHERFRNITLEVARHKAELDQLKSQLNPHFLFNSLNGIRALVALNPQEAKAAITHLSELLRSTLNFGKHDKINLHDEIKMVENYLHLEQMRLDERLSVDWTVEVNSSTIQLPPFTLQLLVENAIKHGISNQEKGGKISIAIFETDEMIKLEVINPGNYQPSEKQGIGIDNLISRLTYFYSDKATFSIENNGNNVIATVTLPRTEL